LHSYEEERVRGLYFGIDLEIVWEVVITELPPIKPLIQKVLEGEET